MKLDKVWEEKIAKEKNKLQEERRFFFEKKFPIFIEFSNT
jgi:hypothetical protein